MERVVERKLYGLVVCRLTFGTFGAFALRGPMLLTKLHLERTTCLATNSGAVMLWVGDSGCAGGLQVGVPCCLGPRPMLLYLT